MNLFDWLGGWKIKYVKLQAEFRRLSAQVDNMRSGMNDIVNLHKMRVDALTECKRQLEADLDEMSGKYWALKDRYEPSDQNSQEKKEK